MKIANILCPVDFSETSAHAVTEAVIVPSQPFVTREIRSGKPYEQILDVAAREQSDLIVVGVGGRGLIDLALLGSTANHVVRSATCPVLTLRRTVAGSSPQEQRSPS